MKIFFLITLMMIPFASFSQTHRCQIYSIIQRYDITTMAFKSATEASSPWFVVTKDPHENEKELNVDSKTGVVGTAKVWTGTLLETEEGDLIQAHARFLIEGVRGPASLIMSLDSSLAKSSVVLEMATEIEMVLIPVDLKCVRISKN